MDHAGQVTTAPHAQRQRLGWGWWLAIALLGVLAFQPALRNEFAIDDIEQVQDLALPQTAAEWLHAPLEPWWPEYEKHTLWRPVPRMTILAQKALHAGHPALYYAANIALLIFAAWVLAAVALRLGFVPAAAGIAGCLFALHPLHSEGVHQIVGRAESLAALFMLLGIWAWLRWGTGAWWQWPLQAACFALALGSKESAITYPAYPCLIVLLTWRRGEISRAAAAKGLGLLVPLLLAVAGTYIWMRWKITGGVFITATETSWIDNPLFGAPLAQRLPAVCGVFAYALLHFFYPHGLVPDYASVALPVLSGWQWPLAGMGLALVIGLVIYAVSNFKRGGRGWALVAAGVCAYGITSNLILSVGVLAAERLWFWPLAALCLAAGWWLDRALEALARGGDASKRRRLRQLACGALFALLLAANWSYARAWRNAGMMAEWTLDRYPQSQRSMFNIAIIAYLQRDFRTCYDYALRAWKLHPDASALDLLGSSAAALEHDDPTLRGKADEAFKVAVQMDPNAPEFWRHWGLALEGEGRTAEAIEKYETYLARPGAAYLDDVRRRIARLRGLSGPASQIIAK